MMNYLRTPEMFENQRDYLWGEAAEEKAAAEKAAAEEAPLVEETIVPPNRAR